MSTGCFPRQQERSRLLCVIAYENTDAMVNTRTKNYGLFWAVSPSLSALCCISIPHQPSSCVDQEKLALRGNQNSTHANARTLTRWKIHDLIAEDNFASLCQLQDPCLSASWSICSLERDSVKAAESLTFKEPMPSPPQMRVQKRAAFTGQKMCKKANHLHVQRRHRKLSPYRQHLQTSPTTSLNAAQQRTKLLSSCGRHW
jgi:hypothetical protein